MKPLDPFSLVVDEQRKWTPDWYQWLNDLSGMVTPGSSGGALSWIRFTSPAAIKQGLNVGSYIDGIHLIINPGTLSDAGGNFIYSSNQNSLPHWVDVTTTGIQRWTPPQAGTDLLGGMIDAPAVNGDSIFLLVVARDSDNRIEVMGSKALTYVVTPPPGWHAVRYLPFAVKYLPGHGVGWSGIPDFFTDVHGGNRLLLSGFSFDSTFLLGSPPGPWGGTGSNATGTPLSTNLVVIPCLTLIVGYRISMNPANVVSGTASIRVAGVSPFPLGQVNTVGDNVYGEWTFRTSTSGSFDWFTTGGAQLTFYLKGWWFEEPV